MARTERKEVGHFICSRTVAQRLKQAGVPQESMFYWYRACRSQDYVVRFGDERHGTEKLDAKSKVSAFTADELVSMLPSHISQGDGEELLGLSIEKEYDSSSRESFEYLSTFSCRDSYSGFCSVRGHDFVDSIALSLLVLLDTHSLGVNDLIIS